MSRRTKKKLDRMLAEVVKMMQLVRQCHMQFIPMNGFLRLKIRDKQVDFKIVRDMMNELLSLVMSGRQMVENLKKGIANYDSQVKAAEYHFRSDHTFKIRVTRVDPDATHFFCETMPLQMSKLFNETNDMYSHLTVNQ